MLSQGRLLLADKMLAIAYKSGIQCSKMRFLLAVLSLSACAQAEAIYSGDAGGVGQINDAALGTIDASSQPDAMGLPNDCEIAIAGLRFDFEGSPQGFVHGKLPEVSGESGWTFDHWEHGNATGPSCPSGLECWGTNLDGNYIQCQRAYLVSPPIDLRACGELGIEPTIRFEHNYHFWTGAFGGSTHFDGGRVEISSDGVSWQPVNLNYPGTIDINPNMGGSFACVQQNNFSLDGLAGFVGDSGGWVSENFTVPSNLATMRFQVRFVYSAGVSSQTTNQNQSTNGTESGWFVDNLRFEL